MASSSFVARVLVAGLSGAALVACTSALGTFTIDNTLDGGTSTGGKDGGPTLADGASSVDSGGGGDLDAGEGTLDGSTPKCAKDGKFVFVTHDTFAGNFGTTGTAQTPIQIANARCQAAATVGKLPGTYHAWLSEGQPAMAEPGSLPSGALFSPSCVMIKSANAGGSGKLLAPLNEGPSGEVIGKEPAWTATKTDGTYIGGLSTVSTCLNWTNATMMNTGGVGNVGATDDTWSDNGTPIACTAKAHFYCIQE
jgi:hypothetical protein